jgi:hypothetical protein
VSKIGRGVHLGLPHGTVDIAHIARNAKDLCNPLKLGHSDCHQDRRNRENHKQLQQREAAHPDALFAELIGSVFHHQSSFFFPSASILLSGIKPAPPASSIHFQTEECIRSANFE